MVQRFVSSMRPTIYASAAFCRHIIACPGKCISYLSTCSGWYLLGFFTWPAYNNSFWWALPPTVGLSFLHSGSSLPNLDGPASTAIWINCWVDNDNGDCPTSPTAPMPPPISLPPLSWVRPPWLGWVVNWRGALLPFSASIIHMVLDLNTLLSPPLSPFLRVSLVLAILKFGRGRLGNMEVVGSPSHESCVVAILNF